MPDSGGLKIAFPSVHGVLPRPRLFARLDALSSGGAGLWIWGPAGSGKSTLVASYFAAQGCRSAWFSIDAADADPAAMFATMAEALAPGSASFLPRYTPEWRDRLDQFSARWSTALLALPDRAETLIIDGLGADVPSEAWDVVSALAIELARHLAVCITAQSAPGGGWLTLIAQRRIAVVIPDELALTQDEISDFIDASGGQREDAQRLLALTEGWAAGVALVRALPDCLAKDPASLRELFSHLVLRRFSPQEQVLLKRLAWLPWVDAQLAKRMLPETSPLPLLESLSARHCFVRRAGESAPVWVLHELLRRSLLKDDPDLGDKAQAITALSEQGVLAEAWQLLRDEPETRRADWLARHASAFLLAGSEDLLVDATQTLNDETLSSRPWLAAHASAVAVRRDELLARRWLEFAWSAFATTGDDAGQRYTAAIAVVGYNIGFRSLAGSELWARRLYEAGQSHTPALDDPLDAFFAGAAMQLVGDRALSEIPLPCAQFANRFETEFDRVAERLPAQAFLILATGWLVLRSGNHEAGAALDATIQRVRQSRSYTDACPVLRYEWLTTEATVYFNFARTRSLEATLDEMQVLLSQRVPGDAHLTLAYYRGQLALERHSIDDAKRSVEQALDTAKGLSCRSLAWALHLLARCHLAQHRWVEAEQAALRATEAARTINAPPQWVQFFSTNLMYAYLGRGMFAKAIELARACAHSFGQQRAEYWRAVGELIMAYDETLSRQERDAHLHGAMKMFRNVDAPTFLVVMPEHAAQACARALEIGAEPDFVRAVIRQRNLPAPPGTGTDWPWRLRVLLLGAMRLEGEYAPPRNTHKSKQKLLDFIALLALRLNDGWDLSDLAAVLWPDASDWRKSLDMAVSRIRLWLGDGTAVLLGGGRIHLDATRVFCDYGYYRCALASIETAHSRPTSADCKAALDLLAASAAPLLAGNDDYAAFTAAREGFRADWLRAALALARRMRNAGACDDAIALLERALSMRTDSESIFLELMTCHEKAGRPAEAIALYRRCRTMLHLSGGVEPSHETRSLAARLGIS